MPAPQPIVITPASPQLDQLCRELASRADTLSTTGDWPREQLQLCAEAGVFRWFVPRSLGGLEWQPRQLAEGYLKLGAACLTTTFVITQWVAAVKRLLLSEHPQFVARRETLIEDLLAGRSHITVGISHLTTSRRHLSTPVLQLQATDSEFRLQGFSPWVTAASFADYFLIGATQADGQQALLLVEAAAPGITIESPQALVALSASCTGAVRFEDVRVPATHWIAGPRMNVLSTDGSVGTGGIQTSSLALALSKAAIDFIAGQADQRPELLERQDPGSAMAIDLSGPVRIGRGTFRLFQRGVENSRQQPGVAIHPGGAGSRERSRFCGGASGGTLVSRSHVLPGLELPADGAGRKLVRISGDPFLAVNG